MNVQALFVDPDGIYPQLLGMENCWDEARDARLYAGPDPVVAHPPCFLWTNFAAVNWKRYKRQRPAWYPGGDDGGMFRQALISVRDWGGVLEHPAYSHAWEYYRLQKPYKKGWTFASTPFPHWTCEVWQSAYGHPARKKTWLLMSDSRRGPPELDWRREPGTHQVGWFDRKRPTVSKKEASATPERFARELIRLAKWSRGE